MPIFFKERTIGLLAGLFFLIIGGSIGYFGIADVYSLFNSSDIIIFSRLSILAAMSPLVFFSMLPLSCYLVCTGKQAPDPVQKKMGVVIVIFAIIIFITTVIFSSWYTSHVEKEGYVKCSGAPVGYMPFMAVKYVIFESMCTK